MPELPVVQPVPVRPERADAARNRERILCAARRLFEEQGVDGVSMDAVAALAGVGKGTLYRRFGDRAGLAMAMVEVDEERMQDALIRGEPPLGPGAPPAERLHAFGDALVAKLEEYGEFLLAAEASAPGLRFRSAVYAFYRTHVLVLLREALGDDQPVEYLADALMAPLAAETWMHQRRGRGMPLEEVRAGWHVLADAVLALGR